MLHKLGVLLHLPHHQEPWGRDKALLHLVQFEKKVVDCWLSWLMQGKGHFLIKLVASLYNWNLCIKSKRQVNQYSRVVSSIKYRYSGIDLSTMYIETAVWTSPISAKWIRVSRSTVVDPQAGLSRADSIMSKEEVWSSIITVWPVLVPLFGMSSILFPLPLSKPGMEFRAKGCNRNCLRTLQANLDYRFNFFMYLLIPSTFWTFRFWRYEFQSFRSSCMKSNPKAAQPIYPKSRQIDLMTADISDSVQFWADSIELTLYTLSESVCWC